MSSTLEQRSTTWQAADPWVTAGVAALGELLVSRGLCGANPASNAGASWANEAFVLIPGRFVAADLEVRWNRHIAQAALADRGCSRVDWKAIADRCRASIDR